MGRVAELNKFGIKVLRFTNDQVDYKIEWVIECIQLAISELTPIRLIFIHIFPIGI